MKTKYKYLKQLFFFSLLLSMLIWIKLKTIKHKIKIYKKLNQK